MKANKVPKKLYGCYKGNGNFFMDYRPFPNDESIEYTRTNAFIEKACEWLKENADMYETFDSESKSYYMDKDKLVEDFKEYMKGE